MKTNQKKINRFSVYAFFLSFIIFFTILYGEDLIQLFSQSFTTTTPAVSTDVETERKQKVVENANDLPSSTNYYYLESELRKKLNLQKWIAFAEENEEGDFCNLFEGKWVWDEEGHHPLYPEETCPYIQPQLTCKEHGRPDFLYQHWRWQPNGCSMPRFNATKMLEALRGKRMLYVGDSLNRGQYVSMVCLIHRLIPEERKSMETNGSLTIFTAKDYNASIEFYWAPFLLESNSDDAVIHRVKDRIIRADSIEKHAQYWKGADILVFNTYLWWMTGYKTKILLRGSFEDEEKVIGEYEVEDAYRLSMKSMARWVEQNMDPSTTRVFFTSMSPTHENGKEWGDEGGNCFNQTMPILDDLKFWGGNSKTSIMKVIGEVFSEMSVPITLLNITQLSLYRKDAHTQIYKKQWTQPTPEQIANPVSYADCVHWCLPGLQDTWNELLYTKLFYP